MIAIDQDFERRLQAGRTTAVQVIADGRNSNTAGTAVGYVGTAVAAFNADWRAAHGAAPAPLRVGARVWYNPNLETRWNFIPSLIGTPTMLQTLLLTTMSVAREREQGTFDQLLVTPFRPGEIMVGKTLPSVLVGIGQATTVLLVAQLWFRIPFAGHYLTLYAGLALFLFAAVGIGLLLSGLSTPIANMPEPVQYFTLINPLRYAIEFAQRVYLEGAGFERLATDLWPLVAIAAVTLSAAAWLFRRRMA